MDQSLEEVCQASNDTAERRQGVAYPPPEDQDVENLLEDFARHLRHRQDRPPATRSQR